MPDLSLIPKRAEYYVQTGSMFENPYGVPHDEIVSMLLELPAEMAAQVIFGKYVESSGLVFPGETIQMLIDRAASHFADQWDTDFRVTGDRWHDKYARSYARTLPIDSKRQRYATGVDFARQTDYTVLFTLDVSTRPARVVYFRRLNRVPWESIYRECGRAAHMWGPSILADSTGMGGDVIFENLESRYYCPIHDRTLQKEDEDGGGVCRDRRGNALGGCGLLDEEGSPLYANLGCVDGFEFQTKSKKNLMEHLRNTLQVGYLQGSDEPFGWLRSPPIAQLEEELSFYAWDDKGLMTDCVMALALAAWQGLEDVPQPALIGSIHGQ